MYKIDAIIRREKLDQVKKALEDNGYAAMTVTDVKGRGRQKGITLQLRAGEYNVDLIEKTKIEIAVADETDTDRIIEIISEKADTGKVGDGKIFVYELKDVARIRTKERGFGAI